MESALTRDEQKELMGLLGLDPGCWGAMQLMRRAYHKKCLEYHPDKGGDGEKMKRMNVLYKKVMDNIERETPEQTWSWNSTEIPTYGTAAWDQWWQDFNDLFCDEAFEDPSPPPPPPTPTPEEEDGTSATPPKRSRRADPTEMPDPLKDFLSNALFSNKTFTSFMLYTTAEKAPSLYKKLIDRFHATFCSRHSYPPYNLIFVITSNKHRVSAIQNFAAKFCTYSFILVRAVLKEYQCYMRLTFDPFAVIEETLPGGLSEDAFGTAEEAKQVDWKLVQSFALGLDSEDVHLVFGYYLEFALPPNDCFKCKQENRVHKEYHEEHYKNAQLFRDSKSQKNICQQAVDAVIASRRVKNSCASREELLKFRFQHLLAKMDELCTSANLDIWMAAVAWFSVLDENIDSLILNYLRTIVENIPKKRYFLFMGPINTGKTTLAAALLDLCGGRSLNINMPFDRINFELGMAIDQFTVLFEDVKGSHSVDKNLPTGQGVNNLDNLRDYLDGSIKVNLEKKHINKKTQIFPPGIVTMNEYVLPKTLHIRFKSIIHFSRRPYLRESLNNTPDIMKNRMLHSGITLLLLLIWYCPVAAFDEELHDKIVAWKETLEKHVSPTQFAEMIEMCKKGGDMLHEFREDTQTQDTGINSETFD
ncbi:large T antigen [Sciurus carolinensis polyomavirus 1]|uniref:Large T antigen n=1 Tax=Sciurus carolinensis polyomavirus 1 TaxID=2721750 RepID=A0A6G9LUL0_9POLY|nr:large T antigen [Sciurus carolinensis polyomavirus 1]QIQ69363.1 large T antigen [Sciurus carolinensis polyomavirus 1]QIQ69369.1 large T antigen [Sciurus carolinensis polyomavirus 1]QIQ69374.1 large T antigen [Sciurus carolinensis polyomavirus 1]